jgi:dTDP-4-amino-4,6-dideoxygalactose transaminase
VLAAGLRPVMAPVSANDGNIDPAAVPHATWSSLGDVLTTTVRPARSGGRAAARCDRLGIPLIEDAAHAIQTEVDGRPIGGFGTAAAFSLSKHARAGGGGVVAFADPACQPRLEALRDRVLRARRRCRPVGLSSPAAERPVYRTRLVRPARYLRRTLGRNERSAYRMPLRAPLLGQAAAAAPQLHRFEPWVRVDLHHYAQPPRPIQLRRMLARLRDLVARQV